MGESGANTKLTTSHNTAVQFSAALKCFKAPQSAILRRLKMREWERAGPTQDRPLSTTLQRPLPRLALPLDAIDGGGEGKGGVRKRKKRARGSHRLLSPA